MTTTRTPRAAALAALAAVGLALAAGTAMAETNQTPPSSDKKGCEVQLKAPSGRLSITYAHGYSFSVADTNDHKTHTYKCNDGKWEETISITSHPTRPTLAVLGLSHGALRVTRPAPAPARRA